MWSRCAATWPIPPPAPYGAGLDLIALRADGSEIAVDISLSPVAGPEGVRVVAVIRVLMTGTMPPS